MITKAKHIIVILGAIFTSHTITEGLAQAPKPIPITRSSKTTADEILPLLLGYQQWTRATKEPFEVKPSPLSNPNLCGRPTKDDRIKHEADPHTSHRILVFVNDVGAKAMVSERPQFPIGSIIVKEKWPQSGDAKSPELLTVMIKREKGYNPNLGDWEFAALDGVVDSLAISKGGAVIARGKIESCQNCHKTIEKTDYVFRSYLGK